MLPTTEERKRSALPYYIGAAIVVLATVVFAWNSIRSTAQKPKDIRPLILTLLAGSRLTKGLEIEDIESGPVGISIDITTSKDTARTSLAMVCGRLTKALEELSPRQTISLHGFSGSAETGTLDCRTLEYNWPPPSIEDLKRVDLSKTEVDLGESREPIRRPLENLARWQLVVDPECASTEYVFFDPDDRRGVINCSPPCSSTLTSKNVFYSITQVLELDRLIEGGKVPDRRFFKPVRQVGPGQMSSTFAEREPTICRAETSGQDR